ncbi:MAG: hypothetical protein HKP58_01825 [Desulfatitalea sp.]|nr:hypothetical protein [Desulfatitalea sp.]NNJ99126.1 hypothetical protein [Desulfatitalea sp.]
MTDGGVSVSSKKLRPSDCQKYWRHHIDTWPDSGVSQRAYCRNNHLKQDRFSHWKRRLAKDHLAAGFVAVPLPAHLPVPIKSNVLHLCCPNGFRSRRHYGNRHSSVALLFLGQPMIPYLAVSSHTLSMALTAYAITILWYLLQHGDYQKVVQ